MSRRACFRVLILANPALATCGGQGTFSWIQSPGFSGCRPPSQRLLDGGLRPPAGAYFRPSLVSLLGGSIGRLGWIGPAGSGAGGAIAAGGAPGVVLLCRTPGCGEGLGNPLTRRHRRRWKIDGGCWVATPCSRPCERQTIALQHLELGGQQIEAGGHQRHAIGADLRNAHPADGQSPEEGHLDAVAVRG